MRRARRSRRSQGSPCRSEAGSQASAPPPRAAEGTGGLACSQWAATLAKSSRASENTAAGSTEAEQLAASSAQEQVFMHGRPFSFAVLLSWFIFFLKGFPPNGSFFMSVIQGLLA